MILPADGRQSAGSPSRVGRGLRIYYAMPHDCVCRDHEPGWLVGRRVPRRGDGSLGVFSQTVRVLVLHELG
jgi:hypothetical protein